MAVSEDIVSQRLRMLPFSEEFISDEYISWLNDKDLIRYSEQRHKTHNKESCLNYLKSFNNSPNYFWAVVEEENQLGHIGNISAYLNLENKVADLGILIAKKEAKKSGYGLEAWKAVSRFLFMETETEKISAGCMASNKAMLKLMQKAKMQEDGIRNKHYLYQGKRTDIVHMALFKEDFLNQIQSDFI